MDSGTKLLQQVVISLVLIHDLHVQLWLLARSNREPLIKGKQEEEQLDQPQ